MSEDPAEFLREWCQFGEHRAYLLMAIARRKFNEELTHNSEIVYRFVLRNDGHIEQKWRDLRALIDAHDHHFRVYVTVNARNTLDTYFHFREEMNQWVQDYINGDEHASKKFGKLDSYWKSVLHRPACRDDQYFHFDVDDVSSSEIEHFIIDLGDQTPILSIRDTPNGHHIITKPFNYTGWEPPVEYDDLDTDGQLFVAEIDNRQEGGGDG